jgi:enamine deaminase RidA (YjgF/YER057c/UK114 family)
VERRITNPWTWQDAFGFVQAHEVSDTRRVLFCSGQTSVNAEGVPIHAGDMRAQVTQALDNLETVLGEAGFSLSDVVRLTIYTTDVDRLLGEWDALLSRLSAANCQPASTLLGVARLFAPEVLIELEVTAVA